LYGAGFAAFADDCDLSAIAAVRQIRIDVFDRAVVDAGPRRRRADQDTIHVPGTLIA
jgi:hypothetical protein